MVKYYVKSNTPSAFQQSTNSVIDRIASHRSDSTDVTRRRTTDERDDDARGCSSGDATRDERDERDGERGGATDDECECGVAKVLRGTCD